MTELLRRVRPGVTAAVYESLGTEESLRAKHEAAGFTAPQWQTLYLRLRALSATIRDRLDSGPQSWSLGAADTAWVSIPGVSAPQSAADIASWVLALLGELAAAPGRRRTLVILDEFSAIGSDPRASEAAAGLVERTRSAGMAIVLGTQTTASLGEAGPRLLQTAGTVLAHRTPNPDDIVALAGTSYAWEDSHRITETGGRRPDSGRLQRQYRVDPDLVRALPLGEAVLIHAGRWVHVAVAAPQKQPMGQHG